MDTEGLIGGRTGSRPLITEENCSEQGQDGWANIMEWPVFCRGSGWGEPVPSRGGVPCNGQMTLQGLGMGSGQSWLPLQAPTVGQKEEAKTADARLRRRWEGALKAAVPKCQAELRLRE